MKSKSFKYSFENKNKHAPQIYLSNKWYISRTFQVCMEFCNMAVYTCGCQCATIFLLSRDIIFFFYKTLIFRVILIFEDTIWIFSRDSSRFFLLYEELLAMTLFLRVALGVIYMQNKVLANKRCFTVIL